jgi:hypothetical protein
MGTLQEVEALVVGAAKEYMGWVKCEVRSEIESVDKAGTNKDLTSNLPLHPSHK